MDADEIANRRQYRSQLLEGIYDITKGAANHHVGLASLGAKLGIPPAEVRLAWSSLMQQGLVKSAGVGPELQVFMTRSGVDEVEESATRRAGHLKGAQAMNGIRVFVSHSAKDAALAKALVDCLEACIEVPDKAIRCTSVPGYKLAPGDVSDEELRENLEQCSVVIGLLTEESLRSGYVVMELGAAWGLQKTTCALLAPSVDFARVPGPLSRRHAVKIDCDHDIVSVMDVVAEKTAFPLRNRARSTAAVGSFLAAVKASPSTSPECVAGSRTDAERQFDVDAHRAFEIGYAKVLLASAERASFARHLVPDLCCFFGVAVTADNITIETYDDLVQRVAAAIMVKRGERLAKHLALSYNVVNRVGAVLRGEKVPANEELGLMGDIRLPPPMIEEYRRICSTASGLEGANALLGWLNGVRDQLRTRAGA